MSEIETLAQQIAQTGRDEMARVLADAIADLGAEYDGTEYREGAEDMLNTLVQAGATDPRQQKNEPTTVAIETDEGVVRYEV